MLDMKFRDIKVEIGITRIVVCKNREQYMCVCVCVCVCVLCKISLSTSQAL
jgi:hypothetical protein